MFSDDCHESIFQNLMFQTAKILLDIGRPVRVGVSEARISQILRVCDTLTNRLPFLQHISEGPPKATHPQSDAAPNSCERLRECMKYVDTISLSTSQLVLNFELKQSPKVSTELHSSLLGINLLISTARKVHLGFTNPTFLAGTVIDGLYVISADLTVKDFQIKTQYQSLKLVPLVRPWTFTSSSKLSWMVWSIRPYFEISFSSEVLSVDVGPENLFCLMEMFDYLSQKFSLFKEESSANGDTAVSTEADDPREFVSQDDLRAGFFNYVQASASKEPRPYQVVFDNNLGTMVWCYPDPRVLAKVEIFPVPFVAASEVAMSESVDKVMCALQYFDPLRKDFITYRQFELSESQFCQLELPSLYEKQRLAVATKWRVWIDYSEDNSGELRPGGGHLLVAPAALAACMRVDSIFCKNLIPHSECVVSMNCLQINIQNHLSLTGKRLPTMFENCKFESDLPEEHTFLTLNLKDSNLRSSSWSNSLFIDACGSIEAEILNYIYLSCNSLLEPTKLSCKILVHESISPDKPRCVDSKVFVRPLFLHFSQSSIHTLSLSHQIWNQVLSVVPNVTAGKII